MTVYDVVKKLIGPIDPAGASHIDEKRYENLEATIELVDLLLQDIRSVAYCSTRQEHSMQKAGLEAKTFLKTIKDYGDD